MTINHPVLGGVIDFLWLGFVGYVWYLFVRRILANRHWKRVPGKVNDIVVMGYVLNPYAMCSFTFTLDGKEVKGFDMVPSSKAKALKSTQTIEVAVDENNPKKSIVCDMGWPLYGLPIFIFALMTVASLFIIAMQYRSLFG